MSEKYEWSDRGRDLLNKFIIDINELGGIRPTYHTIILENSKKLSDINKAKKSISQKEYRAGRDRLKRLITTPIKPIYNQSELSIIKNNMDIPVIELARLLKGRSYNGVKAKRLLIIKQLNNK